MKEKLFQALIEGSIIRKGFHYLFVVHPLLVIKRIERLIAKCAIAIMARTQKIAKNKIVFMTYSDDYICNPKWIAEEILRRELPWDLVWVVPRKGNDFASHFPDGIRLVKRASYAAFKEISTAKIWVDNSLNFAWDWYAVPKKKGQYHLETWHGSMGIKRVGKDDVKNAKWAKHSRKIGAITDYCISNSTFENQVYSDTHWEKHPKLMYGHARNDCFFNAELMEENAAKVREYYQLAPDAHIFLYAPTFRDDGRQIYPMIDFDELIESLEKKFGGEWVVLVRLHFHDRKKKLKIKKNPEKLKNATSYPDMQELLMAADAGMTDYSSWAYDFILTKRPLLIFAPDLEMYNTERGLYFPLETTPFPICKQSADIAREIEAFDNDLYQKRIVEFLEDKGCCEDGHAAERVVDKIAELMEQ